MTATKRKTKAKATAVATREKKPGTALMIRQEGNTPASATQTMVALAQSPTFDAEKFKALAEFQQNMVAQQALLDFNRDFHAMWERLPSISRDGKITIRDKNDPAPADRRRVIQATPYATFPNIMKAVKPCLTEHGFSINHVTSSEADGRPIITSTLRHRSGHSQTSTIALQLDTTGSKNNVQGAGSAISYGKRYNTIGLLNLVSHASEDKDDDGVIAGDAMMAPLNPEQLKTLKQTMKEKAASVEGFCEFWGLNSVEDLQQKNYEGAMRLLERRTKKAAS